VLRRANSTDASQDEDETATRLLRALLTRSLAITLAPFAAKIVEVKEKGKTYLRAKRGGLGGRKEVYRSKGFNDTVAYHKSAGPKGSKPMLHQVISKGKIVRDFEGIQPIRERVARELGEVSTAQPVLSWG